MNKQRQPLFLLPLFLTFKALVNKPILFFFGCFWAKSKWVSGH